MALSAYRGGLLKKHPLLGSSVLVDPSMRVQRARFNELQKEAGSMGRSEMLGRLAERYRQFGEPHNARLGEIQAAKNSYMYGSPEMNDLLDEEAKRKRYLNSRSMLYNVFLGQE